MVRTLPFHGRNMGSIPIEDIDKSLIKDCFYFMDSIILKSFIPEIFLSLSILFQLIFNARLVNNLKFNFPIIDQETFWQTFFILFCVILLLVNMRIEGMFSTFLFLNDESGRIVKIILLSSSFLGLFVIFRSFTIQNLNFLNTFLYFYFLY